MYSNGLSEAVIGKAIKQYNIPRHKLVLMTKCFFPIGEDPAIFPHAFAKQMGQSKDYVNQGSKQPISILRLPSTHKPTA